MDGGGKKCYNVPEIRLKRQAGKMNGRLKEVLKFAVTGGVCFLIELAALILLRDGAGLDTLIAVPIAFLISSLVGLGLNWMLMYLFRILFGEDQTLLTMFGFRVTGYMFNKTLATLLVMVFNYFAKRWILRGGKEADQ